LYEGGLWNVTDDELFPDRPGAEGRNVAQYNTIYALIQQIAPMVTANRPVSKVAPKFPHLWKLGESLNHVLKYSWAALDLQMKLHLGVIDAMTSKIGIFKIGYNPDKRFGGPVELSVIDPMDFFIAPGYETIWDAPWCGVKAAKPLAWVRRTWPDVKEVTPDNVDHEDKSRVYKFGDTPSPGEDMEFVTVYEMWLKDDAVMTEIMKDKEGNETEKKVPKYPYGKICFFGEAEWFGEEVATDDHGLPPYVEYRAAVRPHNFLGMSEVDQIEGLHKEINILLKYVIEYTRRRHAPNLLADISRLEDDTIEALKDRLSLGNQIIPWDSAGDHKSPPITQIIEGKLNPTITVLMLFLIQLIDDVSGATDLLRGKVGKKERQSASEIAMLKESGDTRPLQRTRNVEWTINRIYYIILRITMQRAEEPMQMSYDEDGGRVYATYGNSFAQADEIMQVRPLSESAQEAVDTGKPLVGDNAAEKQRFDKETEDYKKFLEMFKPKPDDQGKIPEYDPVFFDFDLEIQSDTTLPTDKQSRANLFLRLLQMQAIDPQSVLEQLQVPGVEEIMKRLKEMMGAGENGREAELMAKNPEAAAKFKQAQGAQ
ncbi:hypothetical protein LCGC14_1798940, partial [marine sediment metagenome]